MKFATVATHPERYFPSLVDSCRKHHCDLVVLGYGQKWQGFTWRLQLMRDFLATLPDDEIVVFIDAFDVVILRDAADIEATFRQMRVPFLISGEQEYDNLLMRLGYNKMYPRKCHGQQICAGCYMGYVSALKILSQEMFASLDCDTPTNDDQQLFGEICTVHPSLFSVDSESSIFLNIHGGSKGLSWPDYTSFDLNNNNYFAFDRQGRIVNRASGTLPCILHGPGSVNMDAVVTHLGYTSPLPAQQQYWWRSAKHYTRYFLWEIVFLLFGLAFVVMLLVVFRRHTKLTDGDQDTGRKPGSSESEAAAAAAPLGTVEESR